ncbi:endothelin-converting enzyme 1-like [Dermacentor variabilis]|uniref:endothelin-converting enzyme 1-like n=1 Tax=Dermacentor variabilis TaxID=34621 RepID=UPI003F5B7FE7
MGGTRDPRLQTGAATPWRRFAIGGARSANVLSPITPAAPRDDVRKSKPRPPSRAEWMPPSSAGSQLPLSPTVISWETKATDTITAEGVAHSNFTDKPPLFLGIIPDDDEGSLEYSVYMTAYTVGFAALLLFITVAASAYFPHCDNPVSCFDLNSELQRSRLVDVDPCDDMFEHVCGRWTSVYPEQQDLFEVLNNRLRVSLLENIDQVNADSRDAVDKAAAAMTACMNVPEADIDHAATIRHVLRQRGLTFPASKKRSTREVFGILVALTLQDLLGVFFQLKLTPYLKAEDRFVFELRYAETMFRYVTDAAVLESCVGAYDPNLEGARDVAERLANVENDVKTITEIHSGGNEQPQYYKFSDIDDVYYNRTRHEVYMTSQWWLDEINKHIPENSVINMASEILIKDHHALFLTIDVLRAYSTSSLNLQTYIAWKVIKYLSYAASTRMFFCHFHLTNVHWVNTFARTLDRCTSYIKVVIPHALLKLQVKHVLDDETINYTNTIADRIRYQMEVSYNFSLFDQESARGVVQRLRSIHQIIGMASKLRSNAALNSYYSHIPKPEAPFKFVDWLVEAHRAVAAHKKRFLQPSPDGTASISRDDWDLTGISVGAFYVIVYHIIYLPGSILLPPFMVPYGPNSYNYGGIGKVIGHELTHAFDPKYLDLNPRGEKQIFYTPQFLQKYQELQNCIVLQANKLTESAVAGNNSISEAFADSAGVEAAYLAYRALPESDRQAGSGYYTADQSFFAGGCYMFCQAEDDYSELSIYLPHSLRCKQPCLNTQEFASAFGCKKGSPMFPHKRCDVHDFLRIAQGGTR